MLRGWSWPSFLAGALAVWASFVFDGHADLRPAETREWGATGSFFNWGDAHAIFYRSTLTLSAGPGPARSLQGFTKPLLVLLHGFPTSSVDWRPVWARLEANFELLALDFLGYGHSDKPFAHAYSMHEQADIAEALIVHVVGAERAAAGYHILSHDIGDTVALELLARHHERGRGATATQRSSASGDAPGSTPPPLPLSCVMLNGGVLPGEHRPVLVQRLLLHPWTGPVTRSLVNRLMFTRALSRVFGADTQPSAAELDEWWALQTHKGGHRLGDKLIKYMEDRLTHADRWADIMRDTRVPMRLINGPADPVSGRHAIAAYRRWVGEAKADTVFLGDGIGHYPHTEDPAGVMAAFNAFHAERGTL